MIASTITMMGWLAVSMATGVADRTAPRERPIAAEPGAPANDGPPAEVGPGEAANGEAPAEVGLGKAANGEAPAEVEPGEAANGEAATEAQPGETANDEAPADAAAQPEAPAEPAPLPSRPPAPPGPDDPRAWGGATETPLPRAPKPVEPSTLASEPWRGRFWLGIGLHASIPVAGEPPARGGVVSAVGEVTLGWRLNRFLALHTSVSTFAHDATVQTVYAPDGSQAEDLAFGRITAFDLVTARVYLPLPRRVEPWAELGAGVGVRREPLARSAAEAVGLIRVGAGVDFWLAPSFTLGTSAAYRTMLIGDSVGHGLRVGADLGVHW